MCASRSRTSQPLARLLPNHFIGILVFPDPEKDRLSESVIPCPFREFDLADHHRLDPMATSHFSSGQTLVPTASANRRKVIKGTFFDPNFVQLRIKSAQKFVAKASSDSASKFKFLALIETDEQRAKILPRSFRFGVTRR